MSQGFTWTREEGAADSHEGFIIKHTLLIGDNSLVSSTRSRLSMILLLFLPFPVVVSLPNSLSLFHAGFFFPFILFFYSDRLGTNTNWAKGPRSHASLPHALSLTLTYTPFIALFVIFEDATLTGIGWRLNVLHSKPIWSETTQRKPKQNSRAEIEMHKTLSWSVYTDQVQSGCC